VPSEVPDGERILGLTAAIAAGLVAFGAVALVIASGSFWDSRAIGTVAVVVGPLLALAVLPFYALRESARAAARSATERSTPLRQSSLVRCRTCGVTDVRYRLRCWNCGHRL
jgi:hypothetical protein